MLDATETERLRLGRAEKALLGVAFGLKESRSQWALTQIHKWQELNAKRRANVQLSADEEQELQELGAQMPLAFEQ
jgi:hypothetical protein